ncbi:alpha-2,8-sialyltransferase 8F-like [Bombina bombina]|uniref:alpha-2,8-sialyltransferase 8F-like n=1 Tax=Bombina bombina TaxID=8345 RepID=UPI00235B01CE|nr:alpha-2,8-sialyltransferase 8F-like [Bombina bombina]
MALKIRFRLGYFSYFTFIVFVIALCSFYVSVQQREHFCIRYEDPPNQLPPETCQKIREIILNYSLTTKNIEILIKKASSELQNCPWIPNSNNLKEIRSELYNCCNARSDLLLTQNNTHLGYSLSFETEAKRTIQINKKIHEMLPKVSPFSKKLYRQCAVVGNGGNLLNSCCGSEIDKADYVFRFNLPPMNYSFDTGSKSDVVTANPSIFVARFSSLNELRKPFTDMMKFYGSALILIPAFSFSAYMDVSFKAYYTVKDLGSEQKVVFFNPNYLKNLHLYWKKKGLNVKRLSSGIMLVSSALENCENVTLYGFWPFSQDQEGKPISHHYYDNNLPKSIFHSMPNEFFFYVQMHSMGILKLKVGRCY